MIRAIRATLVWLGLADEGGPSEERSSIRIRIRWTEPAVIVGIVAGVSGYLIGAQHQTSARRLEPPSHAAEVKKVAGDAFRQRHVADILGGIAQTIYSSSFGELLVSIEGITKPPSGYGVEVTLVCAGDSFQYGALAPRFFGGPRRMSAADSFS